MRNGDRKMSNRTKGFLLALLAGTLWGISGATGQYLFDNKGINATWLVCYRLLFSGTLLLCFLRGRKTDIMSIWKVRNHGIRMLIHSIAGMMMVQFAFFRAIELSNAGTATVLQYLNPAMMLVFFAVVRKKKPTNIEILIVVMALVGVFLVSTGGDIHGLTLSVEALMWGLACAFFSCIYSTIPIKLLEIYDAKIICGWGMLIGGIVLSIVSQLWTLTATVDMVVLMGMLFIIIFGTIIPFSCSLMALPLIGPIHTNLVCSVEPIVAALVAFVFLGTMFTFGEVIGFVCIIGTLIIIAFNKE